jgi:hypothetical protein
VITRLESSPGKLVPYILPIYSLGHLERDLEIAALDSEVKPRLLVLNEMQSDLRVTLLL